MEQIFKMILPLAYFYLGMVGFSSIFFIYMILKGSQNQAVKAKLQERGGVVFYILFALFLSLQWPKTLPDLYRFLKGD